MIKLISVVVVLCSLVISSVATAGEDSGVYIYGAIGQSQQSTLTKDSQDAYMLSLGYQLNSGWAIEGGYVDIGKATYPGSLLVGGVTISNLSTKSSATSLTAVRSWNVPDNFGKSALSILVRFGVAQVKSSASATGSIAIPAFFTVSGTDSYTKRGATFGLGAKYEFDQNWALRLNADSFDTGQYAYGRVPVYSLGLNYKY